MKYRTVQYRILIEIHFLSSVYFGYKRCSWKLTASSDRFKTNNQKKGLTLKCPIWWKEHCFVQNIVDKPIKIIYWIFVYVSIYLKCLKVFLQSRTVWNNGLNVILIRSFQNDDYLFIKLIIMHDKKNYEKYVYIYFPKLKKKSI